MRNYVAIVNQGTSQPGWPTGTIRYWPQDGGKTCAEREADFRRMLWPQRIADTRPAVPLNLPGKVWTLSACNAATDQIIVTDLGEFTDGNTAPVGNEQLPTKTELLSTNPDTFKPVLEWQGGKARLTNIATPAVPAGQQLRYWINGQPPLFFLPTDYSLEPGDELQIMLAISPTPNVYDSEWSQKANILLTVGPAPTT